MSTSIKTPPRNPGRLNTHRNFNYDRNFYPTVEYTTDAGRNVQPLNNSEFGNENSTDSSINAIRNQRSTGDGIYTVRLTEGPSPLMGRLQIYHRGQWRSVCTNSRK